MNKLLKLLCCTVTLCAPIHAAWWDITEMASQQQLNLGQQLILWMPDELANSNFIILANDSFRLETEPRIFRINSSSFDELDFDLTPQFKIFGRNQFDIKFKSQSSKPLIIKESTLINKHKQDTTIPNENLKTCLQNLSNNDQVKSTDIASINDDLLLYKRIKDILEFDEKLRKDAGKLSSEDYNAIETAFLPKASSTPTVEIVGKRIFAFSPETTVNDDCDSLQVFYKTTKERFKKYLLPNPLNEKISSVRLQLTTRKIEHISNHPLYKIKGKTLILPICIDKEFLAQMMYSDSEYFQIKSNKLNAQFYQEVFNWIIFLNYGFYKEFEDACKKKQEKAYNYYDKLILNKYKKVFNRFLMKICIPKQADNYPLSAPATWQMASTITLTNRLKWIGMFREMLTEMYKNIKFNRQLYKIPKTSSQ